MPSVVRTRLKVGLTGLLGLAALAAAAAETSKTTAAVAFVALLAIGSAAYLAWNAEPHHIFTLAIVLAPFAGNWQQLGIPGPLAPERLLIAAGILAVLLRGPAVRSRPRLRTGAVHWVLALTVLYAASSAFFAGTIFKRAPGIELVETFGLFPFLVFTLAPVVFPTARERATLLKGLVGLGAYLSITTLLEITGPKALVFPSYIVNPAYGIHFGYGRGPFADAVANGFGLYACALACLVAIRLWRNAAWRAFAAAVAVLCLVGTLLTLERSVWISTVLASLALLLAAGSTRRALAPIVLVGALSIVGALTFIPGLSAKVTTRTNDQRTVWDRKNLTRTAVGMIEARPLFGVGWGRYLDTKDAFVKQSPDYPLTATSEPLHNVALTYAVELGLVGATLWALSLLLGVGGALLSRGPPDLQPWRVGLLGLFVFFLIEESFVPPTVFQNLCLWLWAGLVFAGRSSAPMHESPPAPPSVHDREDDPAPAPRPSPPPEHQLLPAVLATGCELVRTAAAASWRGPDPYDGLMHPWPAILRGGPRRRQAIVQLHARAPLDVRRLYGRREHPRIAKALGLFGQAALRLDAVSPEPRVHARGLQALELLIEDEVAGDAWGYPFDVQTRWSFYPAGAPNVVVTSFAAAALAEAGARLGEERFTERADRAARWVLEHAFDTRTGAFSYHEHSDTVIHNANLLAARLVWERLSTDPVARDAVRRALERSLGAQRRDGMWAYGEGPGLEWSDSFHTGFVLGALVDLRDVDGAVDDALARGARPYAERFFGARGEARLWPDRRYPEDAHSAGTGMSTLTALRALGLVDPLLPARVASRVLASTVVDGHAVWRRWRRGATHVSYVRWCDAHVALGLADVATAAAAT
jgi:putative inorganic carbon (hco3(-)) transporter